MVALGPTQLPLKWVPGAFSPGVNQLGHEAHRLPPSNAKVENVWTCTFSLPYIFMAWYDVHLSTETTVPFSPHIWEGNAWNVDQQTGYPYRCLVVILSHSRQDAKIIHANVL